MKMTFYYQFPGYFDRTGDAVWWPENCERIEVDVKPGDPPLPTAAEAICVAQYKQRGGHRELQRSGDRIDVYVSEDPNIPGALHRVTLYIDPSADARPLDSKRPVRLPNEAELAEALA